MKASDALRNDLENETAWAGLAYALSRMDACRVELLLLEDGPLPEVLAFLGASPADRQKKLQAIIVAGGIVSRHGKFLEYEAAIAGERV
jgi:hypothetical protein